MKLDGNNLYALKKDIYMINEKKETQVDSIKEREQYASLTDKEKNFLYEQLNCIYSKIQEMNISRKCDNQSQRKKVIDGAPSIVDPSLVRAKGYGKRLKSSKETSTSKSKLCRGCDHRGVSHDKCNCPLLQQGKFDDESIARSTATEKDNTNNDESYEEDLTCIAGSNNFSFEL
ncbi:uncharacterized protein LOC121967349 [Zingiber officinale]|uniref:uncharacterized protein LOC121967349 n=1 Tax=Zingiber officinale TaxID=94328 RepID=UPI001C4B0D25|nr:uncharacterized protein LOC121967349 [Zingiber officinale]